jgi:hypothetical protein
VNWWQRNSGERLIDVFPALKIKLQVRRNYINICHCIKNNNCCRLKLNISLCCRKNITFIVIARIAACARFSGFCLIFRASVDIKAKAKVETSIVGCQATELF